MQTDRNSIDGDRTAHAGGPRTEAGKAISSMNSLKHGLTAKTVVLRSENQADFDRLQDQLLDDHSPAGALETEIVAEIAACLWRLQRARRYESAVLETARSKFSSATFSERLRNFAPLYVGHRTPAQSCHRSPPRNSV